MQALRLLACRTQPRQPLRSPTTIEARLMNTAEHLLTCLAEENVEVAKETTKALRFGLDDRHPNDPDGPTQREQIINELNDVLGVVDLLVEAGILPAYWIDEAKIRTKKEKVEKFMGYAVEAGALAP